MSEETVTVQLGDVIYNDVPPSMGIHHGDSGISISIETKEGRDLRTVGVFYICPHGRCCSSQASRDNWCPECRDEHEQLKALASSA